MRIDYVITGLGIGGAEIQAVTLLERLIKRGHQVRLISLTPSVALKLKERLVAANIPLYSLNMRSALQLPVALWRLRCLLKQFSPDVVHAHMVHANILARLVRLLLPKTKLITTAHNIYEGGRLRDWAYRLTDSLSQLNTTISAAATHRFTRENIFSRGKTLTLFNGIDLEKFRPPEPCQKSQAPFRWLAAGRLAEQKDYPVLLQALAQLTTSHLAIAGKGSLLGMLQKQSQCLGLSQRINFLGVRDDIEKLMQQVDGFVLSSKFEGYGLVVAEAMAAELPVVVTDSGGPAEIVGHDGAAGKLVPIQDPQALAQAMAEIEALSPIARREMGQQARQRIQEKFNIDQIVTQWEQVYTSLIKNRRFDVSEFTRAT
ncbi:MAG: glycosyltransferase [Candidatus Symbiodolus clandestinus]